MGFASCGLFPVVRGTAFALGSARSGRKAPMQLAAAGAIQIAPFARRPGACASAAGHIPAFGWELAAMIAPVAPERAGVGIIHADRAQLLAMPVVYARQGSVSLPLAGQVVRQLETVGPWRSSRRLRGSAVRPSWSEPFARRREMLLGIRKPCRHPLIHNAANGSPRMM